jgi:Uma2 family endonuclease
MSTAALISIQEYLARTEKPNCEYENGVLYPKPMATTLHAWIQSVLILLLSKQGAHVLPELTLRLNTNTFLVPDVAVVRSLQFPNPVDPAWLCVEILSLEDRIGATLAKCEKYHAWGVPFCWVVDPEKQTAWEYAKDGEPARVEQGGILHAGEWVVHLDELFSEVARP